MDQDVFEEVYEQGLKSGIIDETGLHKENYEDIIQKIPEDEVKSILMSIYKHFVY